MRNAWLTIRSLVLWAVSGVHFAVVASFLMVLGIFVDPQKKRLAAAPFLSQYSAIGPRESRSAARTRL